MALASTISSISGSQLGSSVTVNLNSESSNYQHKVEYYFENSNIASAAFGVGSSFKFTPPLDLANQIPNSESGTLTVMVTTFNGSNPIGTAYGSIVLKVPDSVVPTLSGITATRVDNGVPSSWGVYVKGISKVKITAGTASGVYGSTITSCNINGQGLHVSGTSGESSVLSYSGKQTYSCMVMDSRGRYTSKSVEINVVDYAYPTISVSAVRCKSDGTVSADGTYLKVKIDYSFSSVSGKNSITAKSCSCNGASNSSFASGTAFILSANCAVGNQYTLAASIKDGLGKTASMNVTIPTAYRVLNVKKDKKGIAIGKFSEKNAFEVNMDSYFYGDIYGRKMTSGEIMTYGGRFDVFNGSALWVKLGTWNSGYDSSVCKITVLTGNGYNAGPDQNTEIEIFIKDSWQNSASATGAYGSSFIVKYNYDYSISVWVMAQSNYICDVWIRLPYGYGSGTYLFEGNGHWTHSIETCPFDSNPTSGVKQPCKEMTADFKGYPVGSIYLNWDNTNPQTFMGGTWVRMAEGRGLFGIGKSTGRNGFSASVGEHEEFGDWTHQITAAELPPHNHTIGQSNTGAGRNDWGLVASGAHGGNVALVNNSNATTGATGGGESFYTVPPYIGIYVWRRTA